VDHEGGIVAYPYPPAPAERPRPTTVTVSSYLLFAVAAIQLISAVVEFSQVGTMSRVLKDAYAGTAAAGAESVVSVVSVISAVIAILFAAGLAILAIFNNRGKQGARVTTWVIGGLAVCCNGAGVLGNAATRSLSLDSGTSSGPSSAEVERQLNAALPGWYNGLTVTFAVLALICLLGAIVLLALPASNAFFRAAPAGFDPAYGVQPGYPPYPAPYGGPPPGQYGQPAPGQPPYGQPAPGQPPYGQPAPGQPPYGQLAPGQPPYGQPAPGQPPYGQPYGQPPAPAPGEPGPASDPWSAPPPPPPAVPPSPPGSPGSPDSPGGQRPSDPTSGV
jgi:hypothetical protein